MSAGLKLRLVAHVAAAFALIACSAAAPPAGREARGTAACAGQPYVEVRNELPTPVDVYGYVGSTPTFLGTVSTGVRRLPLFQEVGYIYAARDGRRVSSRRGATRVAFTRGCEAR